MNKKMRADRTRAWESKKEDKEEGVHKCITARLSSLPLSEGKKKMLVIMRHTYTTAALLLLSFEQKRTMSMTKLTN